MGSVCCLATRLALWYIKYKEHGALLVQVPNNSHADILSDAEKVNLLRMLSALRGTGREH